MKWNPGESSSNPTPCGRRISTFDNVEVKRHSGLNTSASNRSGANPRPPDGRERYIEVKTTGFGERTPFFVSANEARFARDHQDQFRLYRLFDFRSTPRLFELAGSIEQHCLLDAVTFRASFG